MSDDVKIILVWLGVPVVGALISCILGWLATVSHKKIRGGGGGGKKNKKKKKKPKKIKKKKI